MKNINLGNKNKIIMTIISVIMITIIGVTLAWYVWSSTNTINVSLGTCTPEISFEGGNTINGDGLIPVLSKEEGAIKEMLPRVNLVRVTKLLK